MDDLVQLGAYAAAIGLLAVGLGGKAIRERKENSRLRDLLRRIEWAGGHGIKRCPLCCQPRAFGHDPACDLQRVLAE